MVVMLKSGPFELNANIPKKKKKMFVCVHRFAVTNQFWWRALRRAFADLIFLCFTTIDDKRKLKTIYIFSVLRRGTLRQRYTRSDTKYSVCHRFKKLVDIARLRTSSLELAATIL